MDFVRERRAWEERLKRKAPSFGVEADDAMMDEVDQDMGVLGKAMKCGAGQRQTNHFLDDAVSAENAMPSPTEDREIEELLSYLEADETHSIGVPPSNASLNDRSTGRPSMLDNISEEEEDYDQLFLEVMADDNRMSQADAREQEEWYETHQDQDSRMDLS